MLALSKCCFAATGWDERDEAGEEPEITGDGGFRGTSESGVFGGVYASALFSSRVYFNDYWKSEFEFMDHSLQQRANHGGIQFVGYIRIGQDPGGEFALVLLESVNALLDGVLAEQLVDEDRVVLADAIRPVRRLRLRSGIPPWIVVDDRVGGR